MLWELKRTVHERFGTQGDAAQALSTHESTLSRVIRCRKKLNDNEKQRWASILGEPIEKLFGSN